MEEGFLCSSMYPGSMYRLVVEFLVGGGQKGTLGRRSLLVLANLGYEGFESICTTCRWRARVASCDKISVFMFLIYQLAEQDIEKEKALAFICLEIAQLEEVLGSYKSSLDLRSASMIYLGTTIRKDTTPSGDFGTVIKIIP